MQRKHCVVIFLRQHLQYYHYHQLFVWVWLNPETFQILLICNSIPYFLSYHRFQIMSFVWKWQDCCHGLIPWSIIVMIQWKCFSPFTYIIPVLVIQTSLICSFLSFVFDFISCFSCYFRGTTDISSAAFNIKSVCYGLEQIMILVFCLPVFLVPVFFLVDGKETVPNSCFHLSLVSVEVPWSKSIFNVSW